MSEIWRPRLVRNADWTAQLDLFDESGAPIDITGAEPVLQLRTGLDRPVPVLDCRPSNGRLTIGPGAHQLLLDVPKPDMIAAGEYVGEIELRYIDGRVTSLLQIVATCVADGAY